MPPSTILDGSPSLQILWVKRLSVLMDDTATPSSFNSGNLTATADSSAGQGDEIAGVEA